MKPLSAFLLAMVIALSACKDDRVSKHEKRISELEAKVKRLQEKQQQDADAASAKEAQFKECVDQADIDYHAAVRGNGTKNGSSSYSVDLRVMQTIERQKESKLEECKLLYR